MRDKIQPFLSEWAAPLAAGEGEPNALVNALFHAVDRDPELTRFLVAERVGSSAALRRALRDSLLALGQPLLGDVPASKRTRPLLDASELVTLLILEAAAQLLDSAPDDRPTLRSRTLQRLERAIADATHLARKT